MISRRCLDWFPVFFLIFASCSTNNGLRKFDDSNIKHEIPTEVATKFEVKDVSELDSKKQGDQPVKENNKIKSKKKKVMAELKAPEPPPIRRMDKMPFLEGERLSYDVRYLGVTAATFISEVRPAKVVNQRKVYHLHAKCKTVKLFELVYRVDDTIESFWDFDGLYSHRFTMDLDESKQSRKLIELYDYDKRKSFFWNRIDHSEKGFSEQKEEHDIRLWSQDPLSFIYYMRVAKLPRIKGESIRFPLILDGKPWESVMIFDHKEKVSIGSRSFDSNVYRLENYQNGELKNKENTVWISDDEHQYMLRIEAKVKVGAFAIALDQIL